MNINVVNCYGRDGIYSFLEELIKVFCFELISGDLQYDVF